MKILKWIFLIVVMGMGSLASPLSAQSGIWTDFGRPMIKSSGLLNDHGVLSKYAFYCNFYPGATPIDLISRQPLQTTLGAGRVDEDGTVYGANVPVIDEYGLNTYGSYTQKVLWSEDLTQAAWIKRGTGAVQLLADGWSRVTVGQYGTGNDVYQAPAATYSATGVRVALRFLIRNVSGTTPTLVVANSRGGGTGKWNLPIASFTGGPYLITDKTVGVSVIEPFVSSSAPVTAGILFATSLAGSITFEIKAVNMVEAKYTMPYVKTEGSVVTVPANVSALTVGNKIQYRNVSTGDVYNQALVDAIEGVPTGPNLWQVGVHTLQGDITYDTGDDTYTMTGTNEVTQVYSPSGVLTAGKWYEYDIEVTNYTSGGLVCLSGSQMNVIPSVGRFKIRELTASTTILIKQQLDPTTLTFKVHSVRELADPQGEFEMILRCPDSNLTALNSAILNFTNNSIAVAGIKQNSSVTPNSLILINWQDATHEAIKGFSGTIQPFTEIRVNYVWGTHPINGALKHQVFINGSGGGVGGLLPGPISRKILSHMTFGWDSTEDHWYSIKSLKIYKEPRSW